MITLIGAGFLGSIWAEETAKRFFATEGMSVRFRVIDFDTVEARNCANQNFNPREVGQFKADAVVRRIENYNIPADAINEKLTDDNKDDLFAGSTLIVSATDNMEARNIAWYHATANWIPLLHLGVSQRGTGAVEWSYGDEYESWTLSPAALRGKKAPPPAIVQLRPCELVGFRGLGLNCAIAGAMAAGILHEFDPEHVIPNLDGPAFTTWSVFSDGYSLQESHNLQPARV